MPHIERLRQLRRVVGNIDPEHLDMQTWRCGTVACAAGHAAVDPWHRAEGLCAAQCGMPVYDDGHDYKDGYEALASFYNLGMEATLHLFSAAEYSTRIVRESPALQEEVLSRIDALIAEADNAAS